MKLIEILKIFSIITFVSTQKCIHRYHFWRPYFGEYAKDDFIAATDMLGRRSYIGKIIPFTEKRSWTQPAHIMHDYTQFAWEDGKVIRTDRFMEIMAVEQVYLKRFQWLSVHSPNDLINIQSSHCLIEAGIVKYDGNTVKTYVGRTQLNGSFFIGAVYLHKWVMLAGMHYLNGWERKHRSNHYQVLTYTS